MRGVALLLVKDCRAHCALLAQATRGGQAEHQGSSMLGCSNYQQRLHGYSSYRQQWHWPRTSCASTSSSASPTLNMASSASTKNSLYE